MVGAGERREPGILRAMAKPIVGFAALWAVHVFVALLTTFAFLSAAFGAFDGAIEGRDDLYRLGDGPFRGFVGIWLPVLLNPIAALVALAVAPRYGWAGPVLAMLASVLLAVVFATTFERPAPVLGD